MSVSAPGAGFIHRELPQPPGILMTTGPPLQAAGAVVEVSPPSLAGGRGPHLSIVGESGGHVAWGAGASTSETGGCC